VRPNTIFYRFVYISNLKREGYCLWIADRQGIGESNSGFEAVSVVTSYLALDGVVLRIFQARKKVFLIKLNHGRARPGSLFSLSCKIQMFNDCSTERADHSFELTEKNGGDDGTRTRDLCRDRAAF
jgi:hypothetical protein